MTTSQYTNVAQYFSISPNTVLERLQSSKDGFYLGDPEITSHATWHIGSAREGNLLISTLHDDPTEFILRGAFEIDKRDFFFIPEGNYRPNNQYDMKLAETKASCRLLPIRRDPNFNFSFEHFPNAISNLRKLESMAPIPKGHHVTSCIYPVSETSTITIDSIKISHPLFEPIETSEPPQTTTDTAENTADTSDWTHTTDFGEKDEPATNIPGSPSDENFPIAKWPVDKICQPDLDSIVDTHTVNLIPAYDINNELIKPHDYVKKLSGALVEAHFALKHHNIKSKKKSVFVAHVREIIVLRHPINVVKSPIKRKPGARPSTLDNSK